MRSVILLLGWAAACVHAQDWFHRLDGTGTQTITGIGSDRDGNVYLAGSTNSPDFVELNGIPGTQPGGVDIFVCGFSPAGERRFCRLFGGSADDVPSGFAVSPDGVLVVATRTRSTNFPLMNPVRGSRVGDNDSAIFALSSAGQTVWSTYSPNVNSGILQLTFDSSGRLFAAGTGQGITAAGGGVSQAGAGVFAARLSPASGAAMWSAAIAPSFSVNRLAASPAGELYMAGALLGSALTTTANAVQRTPGGGTDAVLIALNPSGSQVIYASYVGGTGLDSPTGIALDPRGGVRLSGITTNASSIPLTSNAVMRTPPSTSFGGWSAYLNASAPGQDMVSHDYGGTLTSGVWISPDVASPVMLRSWTPFSLSTGPEFCPGRSQIVAEPLSDYVPTRATAPPNRGQCLQAGSIVGVVAGSILGGAAEAIPTVPFVAAGLVSGGIVLNQVRIPLTPVSDLTVTVLGRDYVSVGDTVIYLLSVRNTGQTPVTNVLLKYAIPQEIELVDGLPDSCILSPLGDLECEVGTMAPGADRTVSVRARVRRSGPAFQNIVTATGTGVAGPISDSASKRTQVSQTTLEVTKSMNLLGGGDYLLSVSVKNTGPSRATNVQLADPIEGSAFSTATSILSSRGTCSMSPLGALQCSLGDLAPDESALVSATMVRRLPVSQQYYLNRAVAYAADAPPASGQVVMELPGTPRVDLEVSLDVQARIILLSTPGEKLVDAIIQATVRNLGTETSAPGRLTMDVPLQVTTLPVDCTSAAFVRCTIPPIPPRGALVFRFRGEQTTRQQFERRTVDARVRVPNDINLVNDTDWVTFRDTELQPGLPTRVGHIRSTPSGRASHVPGSDPAIYGVGFAAGNVFPSGTTSLPPQLGGVYVQIDGVLAPLVVVTPGQINFQMPWELQGKRRARLTVIAQGRVLETEDIRLDQFGPEVFSLDQSGSGQAIALIAGTTSLAAPLGSVPGAKPVTLGGYLTIYGIGLGPVSEDQTSGAPAPLDRLVHTAATPTVMLGGVPAKVLFSGLAPGFAGLYQVNVEVAPNTPLGDAVPLEVAIGPYLSNPVTVAVSGE